MDFQYHSEELKRCLANGQMSHSALEEGRQIVISDYKENLGRFARSMGRKLLTVNDAIYEGLRDTETDFLGNRVSDYSNPSILYISPLEAQTLYQAGIPKRIEDNKGRGCLTTGVEIINRFLSDEDIIKVNDQMSRKNLTQVISDTLLSSLCYGGSLLFPVFRRDSKKTFEKPLGALIRDGVVGKDCIDWFVCLDRWNVFTIPPANPTQKDFENPEHFTVPFLGSKVKSSRCSRVVACPQIGYWGKVISLGWGISDFTHYLQAYLDYEMCVKALNGMVKNMSIVYRKIPFTDIMASDGLNAVRKSIDELKEALDGQTMDERLNHIINFDTIGDLGCVNRDFGEMDMILTLKRQDLCAKAGTYEPLIFTIKRGSFSSGDDTQGTLTKQYESNAMLYSSVASQLNHLAMLMVIDSLGTSNRVMKALPYSRFRFIRPMAVSALEKANIGKIISEGVLNYGAMNIPVNYGIDLMDEYVENKDMIPKELRERLARLEERRMRLEEERKRAEIQNMKEQAREQKRAMRTPIEEAMHKKTNKKLSTDPDPTKRRNMNV